MRAGGLIPRQVAFLKRKISFDRRSLDVVIAEPRPTDELQQYSGMVGLEELAKTDRILVQQVEILLLL